MNLSDILNNHNQDIIELDKDESNKCFIEEHINNNDLKNKIKVTVFPDCAICLDSLKSNLATASCGHVFHLRCLRQCIYDNASCPLCRNKDKTIIILNYEIKEQFEDTTCKEALYSSKEKHLEITNNIKKLSNINDIVNKQLSLKIKEYNKLKEDFEENKKDLHKLRQKIIKLEYIIGEKDLKMTKLEKEMCTKEDKLLKEKEEVKYIKDKADLVDSFFVSQKFFEDFKDKYKLFSIEIKNMLSSKDYESKLTSYLYTLQSQISELNDRIIKIKKAKEINLNKCNNVNYTNNYSLFSNEISKFNRVISKLQHDEIDLVNKKKSIYSKKTKFNDNKINSNCSNNCNRKNTEKVAKIINNDNDVKNFFNLDKKNK